MPKYGLSGPCLKAVFLRKSLKAHQRTRHQNGSIPAVKLGSTNVDENATPETLRRNDAFSLAKPRTDGEEFGHQLSQREPQLRCHASCGALLGLRPLDGKLFLCDRGSALANSAKYAGRYSRAFVRIRHQPRANLRNRRESICPGAKRLLRSQCCRRLARRAA